MSARFQPTASYPRLGVVTCNARETEVFAPAGRHLRWFVPAGVGFPAGGFDIRRVERSSWESARPTIAEAADLKRASGWTASLNGSRRDRHYPVHSKAVIVTRADAALKPTSNGLEVVDRGAGQHILIHFNEPVIYVHLALRSRARRTRGPVRRGETASIQVRHGAALIETVAMADEIELERPGITDLLIPNTFDRLAALHFVTELAAAELAEREGDLLAHIDLPARPTDAYKLTAVEKGIGNRFFAGDKLYALTKRYPPAQVAGLVEHLASTVDAPRHRIHSPGGARLASAAVRVLDYLRLAMVDPNVARMLASYWVDLQPKSGLYVIQGNHEDPDKTRSLGFAFSRDAARVPKLHKPTAKQLPGIEFRDSTPLGRAGLTWRIGRRQLRNRSNAVMVDVERWADGQVEWLTEKRPQLLTTTTDLKFTDARLPVPASYSWALTPIDIFGRSGNAVETSTLSMVDLERPVPPKHVVAGIEQHGAPWTDPAKRNAARDRTGAVSATAEFAEAQLTTAPDATELTWCWRVGAAGATERNPSAWSVLHTAAIKPPESRAFKWDSDARLTRYPLLVADRRTDDHAARAALLDRLDPITRTAADAVPAGPPVVEVLLRTALLEPDLFAGHRVEIDGVWVDVLGSTAGIAADDDKTPDRRLTARLFLPDTDATRQIARDDLLHVHHPLGTQWRPGLADPIGPEGAELPPPLIEVPLPVGDLSDGRAEGGELAIDLRFAVPVTSDGPIPFDHDDIGGGAKTTIVGRVVADHAWTSGSPGTGVSPARRSVLVRVRPDDADRLLQIDRLDRSVEAVARHHRPYVMPPTILGLDGAPGDITLALDADQRFATLWISAYAVDAGGKTSAQVAPPAELRAVRPPPDVRPGAPYPQREGTSAAAGQLSLPDVDGESTVTVAWPLPDVGTMADHVRYELGRALGSTIVAADRDRWMRGSALGDAVSLGVVAGPTVELSVKSDYRVHDNGTVSMRTDPPSDAQASTLRSITAGRIRIGPSSTGIHHRIAKITTVAGGPDDGAVEILFRPYVEATSEAMGGDPTGKTCTLEGAPDYAAVLADDDRLRQLADLPGAGSDDANTRAFGLVTGVPVAGRSFVDRLPGRGRSRFFYKVRAVFPGETRSAWSPCSVAFHQIDASQADPPIDLQVAPDGRLVTLRLPDDPLVVGVNVTRLVDGVVADEREYLVHPAGSALALLPARVRSRRGLIDLSAALGTSVFNDPDAPPPVLGIYPADVDRADPPAGANVMVPRADGTFAIARAVAVAREIDGTALAIRLNGAANGGGDGWVDKIPRRFEIALEPDSESDNDAADALDGDAPEVRHRIRTVKRISIRGTEIAFDSRDVPIGEEVGNVLAG